MLRTARCFEPASCEPLEYTHRVLTPAKACEKVKLEGDRHGQSYIAVWRSFSNVCWLTLFSKPKAQQHHRCSISGRWNHHVDVRPVWVSLT